MIGVEVISPLETRGAQDQFLSAQSSSHMLVANVCSTPANVPPDILASNSAAPSVVAQGAKLGGGAMDFLSDFPSCVRSGMGSSVPSASLLRSQLPLPSWVRAKQGSPTAMFQPAPTESCPREPPTEGDMSQYAGGLLGREGDGPSSSGPQSNNSKLICFAWKNNGTRRRGSGCHFRHLESEMELKVVKQRRVEAQSRSQDPTPESRQGFSPVREEIGSTPNSSVVEPYPSPPARKTRSFSINPCFQWERSRACLYGDTCKFIHSGAEEKEPEKRYPSPPRQVEELPANSRVAEPPKIRRRITAGLQVLANSSATAVHSQLSETVVGPNTGAEVPLRPCSPPVKGFPQTKVQAEKVAVASPPIESRVPQHILDIPDGAVMHRLHVTNQSGTWVVSIERTPLTTHASPSTSCEEVIRFMLGASVDNNLLTLEAGKPFRWVDLAEPIVGLIGRLYLLMTAEGDLFQRSIEGSSTSSPIGPSESQMIGQESVPQGASRKASPGSTASDRVVPSPKTPPELVSSFGEVPLPRTPPELKQVPVATEESVQLVAEPVSVPSHCRTILSVHACKHASHREVRFEGSTMGRFIVHANRRLLEILLLARELSRRISSVQRLEPIPSPVDMRAVIGRVIPDSKFVITFSAAGVDSFVEINRVLVEYLLNSDPRTELQRSRQDPFRVSQFVRPEPGSSEGVIIDEGLRAHRVTASKKYEEFLQEHNKAQYTVVGLCECQQHWFRLPPQLRVQPGRPALVWPVPAVEN